MRIAVNNGYYNTKAKYGEKEIIYPTRAQLNIDAGNYIEIDGKRYEIGAGDKDIVSTKDSSLISKLCTLYAISSFVPDRSHVFLVSALPINQYISKQARELYREVYAGKRFEVGWNGEYKTFTIDDCLVYMEGGAVVAAKPQFFKNKAIGVVDIGGYTINNAIFDNQKLVKDSYMSLDLGMYILERKIADIISQKTGSYVKEYQVKYLIETQSELTKSIVDQIIADHLLLLKQSLIEKGWERYMPLYFTGGGALILKEHIQRVFGVQAICEDCIYDTVRGLDKVGEMYAKMYKHN
ncbi:MAG: hypothetical protein ACRDDX_10640 [Cellulosilyticaceae bacterium]